MHPRISSLYALLALAHYAHAGQSDKLFTDFKEVDLTNTHEVFDDSVVMAEWNSIQGVHGELVSLDTETIINGYYLPASPDAVDAIEEDGHRFIHVPGLAQMPVSIITPRGRKVNALVHGPDGLVESYAEEFNEDTTPLLLSDLFECRTGSTAQTFDTLGGQKEASLSLQPYSRTVQSIGGVSTLQQVLGQVSEFLAKYYHLYGRQVQFRTSGTNNASVGRGAPLANVYINGPWATLASEQGKLRSQRNQPPRLVQTKSWPKPRLEQLAEPIVERPERTEEVSLGSTPGGIAGLGGGGISFGTPRVGGQPGLVPPGMSRPGMTPSMGNKPLVPGLTPQAQPMAKPSETKYWSKVEPMAKAEARTLAQLTQLWKGGINVLVRDPQKGYIPASDFGEISEHFEPRDIEPLENDETDGLSDDQ